MTRTAHTKKRTSILYISTTRIPSDKAHTVQIMKICEALQKEGADVHLCAFSHGMHSTPDLLEQYGITTPFVIHQIQRHTFPFLPKTLMFRVQVIFFMIQAWRYAQAHAFDAILTRDWFVATLFSRVFYNVHNKHEKSTPWYKRFALRHARGVIAVNGTIRDSLYRLGVEAEKVRIVTNGVDTEAFARARANRKANRSALLERCAFPAAVDTLVVYTGQVFPWKGVGVLLDAARELPSSYGVLCIGGSEAQIAAYKKTCAHLNVRFFGHVPHTHVPEYTTAADVLVLPNVRTDDPASSYTSPIKLFEYLASGVPVVASDLPTIREIAGADALWYVPAGEAHHLAKMIQHVSPVSQEVQEKITTSQSIAREADWRNRAGSILDMIHRTHSGAAR